MVRVAHANREGRA